MVRTIFIYDLNTINQFEGTSNWLNFGADPISLTFINGKYYKDLCLPYLSVDKIRKFIKGELTLENENIDKLFNKGVFLIIVILGLFMSWAIYNHFLIDLFQSWLIIVSVLLINIAFICLAYWLAKKTGHRLSSYIKRY